MRAAEADRPVSASGLQRRERFEIGMERDRLTIESMNGTSVAENREGNKNGCLPFDAACPPLTRENSPSILFPSTESRLDQELVQYLDRPIPIG